MREILHHVNFQNLYFKGNKYDKPTILSAVDHLAKYLVKNIHSTSPFVIFTACNHIKTVITYYAILKAEKIAVILDPQIKSIELDEMIRDVDPAAIIFLNETSTSFSYHEEIVFRAGDKKFIINSDLKDVCTIAYTNAEDGFSKGAMLTEKNLLSEAAAIIKTNNLTKSSVLCALLPFSHLYGFAYGILAPTMAKGSGLITQLNLLKMGEVLNEIHTSKVTHLHTVPSIYYILSKTPELESCTRSVEEFYSGGIQLPLHIFETFYQKTKHKIREGYGLTEGSPAVAGNYDAEGTVFGSFGKAFPGCEIKIADETGRECQPETAGEICIKGDMVFKGYFNHAETTNKVLRNQWLFTGDFGKKDKNGFIYFCGLKKDMINIAGNKVYPQKLVRLMKMHKNLKSININSIGSILQGSTINATIQLHKNSSNSQDEFKSWCLQNINNALLPKLWAFE